ncbi:hypothetical protein DAEQUDRAFT_26141 [Daedalea quercina L-15889]|uniref:Uncharacterized protein n=1 Tax=Daedalea quercina L-15889 TaxID=1314783 RepID=A0A165SNH6_9APHY|nr:hypothetical protein DAEQUDRAFT_26141 [Daedalea quercina L-15889]
MVTSRPLPAGELHIRRLRSANKEGTLATPVHRTIETLEIEPAVIMKGHSDHLIQKGIYEQLESVVSTMRECTNFDKNQITLSGLCMYLRNTHCGGRTVFCVYATRYHSAIATHAILRSSRRSWAAVSVKLVSGFFGRKTHVVRET